MTIQQLREKTASARYQKKLKDDAEHATWLSKTIQEIDKLCEENAQSGYTHTYMNGSPNWTPKQYKDIKAYYQAKGFKLRRYNLSWK